MIKRDELVKIGQIKKPHGIKGELSFNFTDDSFDESDCPFLICEIEGIFVPFRLEEYRFKSDTSALITLKTIDSEEKAKTLTGKDVYFLKKHISEESLNENLTWEYFIGFTLIDERHGKIGVVSAIDESTINTLFIIQTDEKELLIPANNEIITHINEEQKEIFVFLPDGLLEL